MLRWTAGLVTLPFAVGCFSPNVQQIPDPRGRLRRQLRCGHGRGHGGCPGRHHRADGRLRVVVARDLRSDGLDRRLGVDRERQRLELRRRAGRVRRR